MLAILAGGDRERQDMTVGVQQVTRALAPGPVPQVIEDDTAAVRRAGQCGGGIAAAQVKLATLTVARAYLAG